MKTVRARFSVMPYVADWDSDGDSDFLAGVFTGDFSGVLVFNRGHCSQHDWCLSRGFTKGTSDTCSCILGYDLKDCSGCDESYFSAPPAATLSRECLPCPGAEDGFVCSRRGHCQDDATALRSLQGSRQSRLQLATITGNGSCACNPPFSGDGCENGECPPGQQYAQEELFMCQPCYPGWFKAKPGNIEQCKICEAGHFSSRFGSAVCSRCRSPYFRSVVDLTRTSCDFAAINIPIAIGVVLCSILLVLLLPWMFCPTVPLADVRLQPAGVTISTTGRHWLLDNRLARVSFRHTEVPWLDQGSYTVKLVSERQLLLCDKQGNAVATDTDTSCGTLHFWPCHSARMTGTFGVPFTCWMLLLWGCLAGILYMANIWQESHGFYATYLELFMMCIGALAALGFSCWRQRALKHTDLQRDLCSFERQLQDLHHNPQRSCPRGQERGITAGQLWDFFIFWQSLKTP